MKKILWVKIILGLLILLLIGFVFIVAIAIFGGGVASESINNNLLSVRKQSYLKNNNLYAVKYRSLLNEYLFDYGYVSLERIVWYLQVTNNMSDPNTLSDELWKKAYIENANKEEKQMIPTSEMCKKVELLGYKNHELPQFQVPNYDNNLEYGSQIGKEIVDLCDENYITENNLIYTTGYLYLEYVFPLKKETMGSVTSMVNEIRNVDLDLSEEELASTNFHSGWDFSASDETKIYSICDGTVKDIIFTQDENINFNSQPEPKNSVGNYINIKCDDTNDIASYHHLYPNSVASNLKVNSVVKKGQFIATVGTTGRSTGSHLHLSLSTDTGIRLDALYFVDFSFTDYID